MKTNMQDTSIDIYYNKVLPNLTRKQNAVLTVFKSQPNCNFTNAEIAKKMGWTINRVTPRTLELRHKGKLMFVSRRVCTVTGNTANSWKVNNRGFIV